MEHIVNQIKLCGTVAAAPLRSHENHGRWFYRFPLDVMRLSGAVDTLQILAAEELLARFDSAPGAQVALIGQVRSFNRRTETGRRLIISVFAEEIEDTQEEPYNSVFVQGSICREPVYRRTPLGREICDVMLAVRRHYNRTDFLPCILWGRTADEIAQLPIGATIAIDGWLQSRTYIKQLETGRETRTAYEISALCASAAE